VDGLGSGDGLSGVPLGVLGRQDFDALVGEQAVDAARDVAEVEADGGGVSRPRPELIVGQT
jgi:hypothetical protein